MSETTVNNQSNLILDYLEFNVTDHCNMTCMGCALFSPITKPRYISINQHYKDMARLAELFSGINVIRLIGGEPLLNNHINEVIDITRFHFPNASIHILTNGTLLKIMDKNFWICLKKNSIEIDITIYPVFSHRENIYRKMSSKYEIKFNIKFKYSFKRFIRSSNTGDAEKTFNLCSFRFSTFLRDGMISACHMPSLSYIFNENYGTSISSEGRINIHEKDITGSKIINFLKNPTSTCQYCSDRPEKFDWCQSRPLASNWYVLEVNTDFKLES